MDVYRDSFSGLDKLTKDADLHLVCKDGVHLSVHSLILAKWSEVLHNCLENTVCRGEILLEESSTQWKEVLGLIYPVTPITSIDWENVSRLFQLGDKYQMPGVLQRCEGFLLNDNTNFTTDPRRSDYVLKWLAFAAQYKQEELGQKCMRFVKVNYRTIYELRNSGESGYLRGELASTPLGVTYIIDILQFVMQQR